MISWPVPIGAVVRGADCGGRPFEAAIVSYRGPLTPFLSDGYATPASLIHDVVSLPEGPTNIPENIPEAADDGFLPNDPAPAEIETPEPPAAQLALF